MGEAGEEGRSQEAEVVCGRGPVKVMERPPRRRYWRWGQVEAMAWAPMGVKRLQLWRARMERWVTADAGEGGGRGRDRGPKGLARVGDILLHCCTASTSGAVLLRGDATCTAGGTCTAGSMRWWVEGLVVEAEAAWGGGHWCRSR